MTDLSELLQEAEWSLMEGKDAENALTCVRLAAALLGKQSTGTSVKRKSKKTRTKRKKKKKKVGSPSGITLLVSGKLPDNLDGPAFRAAVLPLLEDSISGEVMYMGYQRMRNGTYCYNFTGPCPVHGRIHTNCGPWQLKQHTKSEWCGFKCWKQDSYKKLFSNPILCSF